MLEQDSGEEFSFTQLGILFLTYRRLTFGLPLILAFATALVVLVRPRSWTAQATFVPQSTRAPSGLSGLAAQFGLSVPATEPSQSPQFYVELLRSRPVLQRVANADYVLSDGSARTLAAYLRPRDEPTPLREDRAIRKLAGRMSAVASRQTGLVTVTVRTNSPTLSRDVVVRLLDEVNRFNLERRQSQAGAERRFVAQRLEEARQELRESEDRLQAFLQRNREYRNAPELAFQQERLARDVATRQQVYTTLAQSVEQARIDEVRDTPVLTVIQEPELPARPDRRGLSGLVLISLLAGAMMGLLVAFGIDRWTRATAAGNEHAAQLGRLVRVAIPPWLSWQSRS